MQRTAIILACLASILAWGAGDEFEIKVYAADEADDAIVVDGKLDEAAWQQAISVGGFMLYGKDVKSEPPTFWRATYDDRCLYLGVTCDEPVLGRLQPVPQARDAHAVFSGETIEIFLDPGHSHGTYYQFAVNAAASVYDSRGEDPTWNAKVRAATGRTETGWTLEFAVPWADLGVVPTPGLLCGINVCRDRQLDGKQWTNWSRVIHGFHDPPRFGHIILSPTADALQKLGPELRKGDRRGPVVIYSQEGFRDATYRGLLEESLAQVASSLAALGELGEQEKNPAVRDELGKAAADFERQLAPLREEVQALAKVGAEEYTRLDLALGKLGRELSQAAWAARLRALLRSI